MARGGSRRLRRQADSCEKGKQWWSCNFKGHPGFAGCCKVDACNTWSLCSDEKNFFTASATSTTTSAKSTSTKTVTKTISKTSSTTSTTDTTNEPTTTEEPTTSSTITADDSFTLTTDDSFTTTTAGPAGTLTLTPEPTASITGIGDLDGPFATGSSKPGGGGRELGLPIGAAVGGFVFLLLVVFGVIWFLRRRKARKHRRSYTPDMFEPDFGHEKRWDPSRLVAFVKKRLGLGGLKAGRWEGRLRDHAANMQAAGTGPAQGTGNGNDGGQAEAQVEGQVDEITSEGGGAAPVEARASNESAIKVPELPTLPTVASRNSGVHSWMGDRDWGSSTVSPSTEAPPADNRASQATELTSTQMSEQRLSAATLRATGDGQPVTQFNEYQYPNSPGFYQRRLDEHRRSNPLPPPANENGVPVPARQEGPLRPVQDNRVRQLSQDQELPIPITSEFAQPVQHQPPRHINRHPVHYYQHPPALVPAGAHVMAGAVYNHGPPTHGIRPNVPPAHPHSFPVNGPLAHGGIPAHAIPMHPNRASYPPTYQPAQYQPYRPGAAPNQAQPPYDHEQYPDQHS
jgi:hypothetical protein